MTSPRFGNLGRWPKEGLMVGLYWEEWEIGAEFVTTGRTVTEADIEIDRMLKTKGTPKKLHFLKFKSCLMFNSTQFTSIWTDSWFRVTQIVS